MSRCCVVFKIILISVYVEYFAADRVGVGGGAAFRCDPQWRQL
jgi:hypothetical protein